MGVFCIVCKKESIPGNKACSFHTFPKDTLLKQKWIDILGLSPTSKHSRVCSDHFHRDSFHYVHDDIIRKRLLRDAVPFGQADQGSQEKLSDQGIAENDQNIEANQTFTKSSCNIVSELSSLSDYVSGNECDVRLEVCNEITVGDDEECSEELHIAVGDRNIETNQTKSSYNMVSELSRLRDYVTGDKCDLRLDECNEEALTTVGDREECNEELATTVSGRENKEIPTIVSNCKRYNISTNPNITSESHVLRPIHEIDVSRFSANKTFRFMDGVQPSSISRADFVSDDAWTRFLKLMVYKNRFIKSSSVRNSRQKKRIRELKDAVKVLGKDGCSESVYVHIIR